MRRTFVKKWWVFDTKITKNKLVIRDLVTWLLMLDKLFKSIKKRDNISDQYCCVSVATMIDTHINIYSYICVLLLRTLRIKWNISNHVRLPSLELLVSCQAIAIAFGYRINVVWVHFGQKDTEYLDDYHHDVIKWKYFPRYWPFVRGIQRSPVIYFNLFIFIPLQHNKSIALKLYC